LKVLAGLVMDLMDSIKV